MTDTWRVNEGYPDHGIIDQHGHLIAMVTTDEDRPQEPEEVLRNAVLIAAAPELLDSAKQFLAALARCYFPDPSPDDEPHFAEARRRLKELSEVIAKAEGRVLE